MTSTAVTPLISTIADDHDGFARALADRVADLPEPPRLLGLGEPLHGEEELGRLRNAVFAALVERAGFTAIALETSAWHGRVVDAHVRGGDGDEDDVLATGFTHGFGASPANRALIRWMREHNRDRPADGHVRFGAFDGPMEMTAAPSPRAPLEVLHGTVSRHAAGVGLPTWDTVDELLGDDRAWTEPAAAMEPERSVGAEPRVRELRAITDELRWSLAADAPRLRRDAGADVVEDALLAGRTAAGLLAYHATMSRDVDDRWSRLAAVRDTMMAENLSAIADRGPTLVCAHNEHLRRGTTSTPFGPVTLQWQPAGAHLADRLGSGYRVIATALGADPAMGVPEPEPDTLEGTLYRMLPPGTHLVAAPALHDLQRGLANRTSTTPAYIPLDDVVLGQVDDVLFARDVATADGPSLPE